MKRKIIKIDKNKCNGCGACAAACHEGAIEMRDGVAYLAREDYCDGLGDCLPACPTGAISFDMREAPAYNEGAVCAAKGMGGCPGTSPKAFSRKAESVPARPIQSRLLQWPCQLKLVPTNAPYLEGASLLIAADCTAYAYGSFHSYFMQGLVTLIGCPKLDEGDYAEKLGAIISQNGIKSVKIVRMEVPCCGGLELAVKRAVKASGKTMPLEVVTISTDGRIIE